MKTITQKLNFIIFLTLLSLGISANAQLISPTGDGGFETGATFALNGWTAVNTGNVAGSQWFLTSAALTSTPVGYTFPLTGTRAAYISNNAGTTWKYGASGNGDGTDAIGSSHIYKDITFPATQTFINLSFRYNVGPGESSFDEMYVYLCPQTLTPVANSPSSLNSTVTWSGTGSATLLGTFRNLTAGAGASSGNIIIPAATAGNTVASSNMRLVFTWKNDGGTGSEPPAALDQVSLTSATPVPFSGLRTVGTAGNYASLGAAFADLVNNGVNGAVTLELQSTYLSSVESFPVTANAIPGSSNTNSITVRPASGATSLSITSANTTATLSLSGGSNIIFDGRPGGTGVLAATNLTIGNTSIATGGTAMQFINDATANTVQYCNLSAAFPSTTSGVLTILGGSTNVTGNDNNTITLNNINGSGTASNGIYSIGTTNTNNGIIISNNNIYDFFAATATNGISVSTGNTDWTISVNRIYQTVTRTFTSAATHTGILISNTAGNNFIVTTNVIGGSSAGAVLTGGPAAVASYTLGGTLANRYRGISMNVGTTMASSVQGNTIAGFTFASSTGVATVGGPWCGIYVNNGAVNIGNSAGNTIGSGTGTGSIVPTTSTTGAISSGIFTESPAGVLNISNNIIGSIAPTASTATFSHGFTGISTATTAAVTINFNAIGSTVTANSINAVTAATGTTAQVVTGILNSGASTNIQITNNIIANLNSAYVPAAFSSSTIIRGIVSSSGVNTITGNTVRNLSTAAFATGTTSAASVIGISLTSATAGTSNLSQNTIFALTNSNSGANAVLVTGIFTSGITAGTVGRNLIYGLDAGNASATISGIQIGLATATYQNNMIRLGTAGTSSTVAMNINGIFEFLGTNNVYHNTIYIGGAPTSGGNASYAFNAQQTTNTRDFRNNIFINARSNGAATGKHYAVRVGGSTPNPAGLTVNYNIYRATGTGAVFGFFNNLDVANLAAWQAAVGQDANSLTSDPCLADPLAATPNLKLTTCAGAGSPADAAGILISAVTDDNEGELRSSNSPTDIGADAGLYGSSGIDMGVTLLVSPTAVTGCKTATETVTVRITNYSTSVIDFSVNNVTVTVSATGGYNSNFVVNTGTLASGATQDVTFPASINLTISGSYVFNAFTSVTGDVNAGNNAMVATTLNILSLGGVYTVGSGGAYPTITAAVAAYNGANCITSAIVFSLIDATYGGSETFPITINSNAIAGINTLTIRPATGVTATISGSVASNALIRLNGADFVTIDGSNSGDTDRSLTITNTATTAPTAISLISFTTGLGAINNTIRNCNISTGVQTTTGYGIAVGGTLPGSTGADNDNTTIQNNNITFCAVGIYAIGTAAVTSGGDDNLNITGNTIDYNGAVTTPISIRVGNILNSSISQNTIDVETTAVSAAGISLEIGANNTVVSRNLIRKVKSTNTTSGSFPRGIVVGTGQTGSAITLSNNVIYNVIANFPSNLVGNSYAGIVIGAIGTSSTMTTATGGVNLYFNSVNISGNSDRSVSSLCMAVLFGSVVSSIDLRNNIFANSSVNINAGATGAKSYAIYSQSANTAFTTINNNDYFVSGSQGVLGFITSDRTDLTSIQVNFGQNLNSVNTNPLFTSSTNLTINSGLTQMATESGAATGTGIIIDYTGATRPVTGVNGGGTAPDMGAYEFDGVPLSPCATPAAQPTALILNATGQTTLSGSYAAASPAPTNYLVVRTTANALAANPVNTTVYGVGATAFFGAGGFVESNGAGLTINSTGLSAGITYYYWIFSFNTGSCSGGPIYYTAVAPLSGSVTTAALFTSIASGNWEDGTTWNQSGGVPIANSDVIIAATHTVTVNSTVATSASVVVNSTGVLNVTGNTLSVVGTSGGGITNGGTVTVHGGILNLGPADNSFANRLFTNNGTLTVTTGTLFIAGRLLVNNSSVFNQSGGDINIDGNAGGVAANSVASGTAIISLNPSTLTSVNLTGGTLTIIDPHANSTASNVLTVTGATSGSLNVTSAHTIRFGNGTSTDAGGNAINGFTVDTWATTTGMPFGNVVVEGPAGTNRFVVSTYRQPVLGNVTVNNGGESRIETIYINGNLTVNSGGIFTSTSSLSLTNSTFATSTTVSFSASTNAQLISGAGIFRNLITGSTANFTALVFNTSNTNGVTFASDNISASGALTVSGSGSGAVTFASGKNLTLGGIVTVTAPATLTFESNSNLIQTAVGTNVGNITVKRNTAMQRLAYTFWGSPVAAQNLLAFSPLTTTTPTSRFYTYSEPAGDFVSITTPGATNFIPGTGYSIRAPNTFLDAPTAAQAFTGTFTGVPNNGTITVTGTRTSALLGDNLVGNPYPCTISTAPFFALPANANVGTLYFWTKSDLAATTGNNYASQTRLASTAAVAGGIAPNGTIQVGQGFFCNLPDAAATITFSNSMKVGNNADQFYRNANTTEKHIIKLNLTSPTANFNQIAVGYVTDGTSGVDAQIDGPTFNGGNNMQTMISSLINGSNYVIQGKGLPFSTTDEFALGFKTNAAGSYTLSTESFDGLFANGQDFFIKDNLTGTTHNIKQTPYNFVSAAGTFNARFQLVYQAVLSVSNPSIENGLVAFVKNDRINIKSTINMTEIKVYDLAGRLIYEKSKINTKDIELNDLKTEHQMLLIQITADGKTVTKKIIY